MELLAPAGDIYSLKAAISAGADAVYLGLEKLNARAKANNFNSTEIAKWVEYCHLRGVKVYVAVNTLIKDSEIGEAIELLHTCNSVHVDALIVQDLALTQLALSHAPNCELHASTQMGIHNLEGARAAKKLGFTRIVLSRETTLDDIKDIKNNIDIEIEYFIHGALCVAFSGNCYFSSAITGCSGNRGQCLQFCRKKYINTINNAASYWLSAKDQCLLSVIDKLKDLGIDSLKIEGRLRSPEYVYSAVKIYRKALNGEEVCEADIYRLKTTFNRGDFTLGYAFSDDVMYPRIQNNIGYRIGRITKCEKQGKNYILTINNKIPLSDGMSCKIIDNGIEMGGFALKTISNNQIATDKPYSGDVHITSDNSISDFIKDRKIPCKITLTAEMGKKVTLTVATDAAEHTEESDYIAEKANNPIDIEKYRENALRLGDSDYKAVENVMEIESEVYIPASVINKLRRKAIDALSGKIIYNYNVNNNYSNNAKCGSPWDFKTIAANNILLITDASTSSEIEAQWLNRVELITNIENYSQIRNIMAIDKVIYIKLPIYSTYKNLKYIIKFLDANHTDKIGIYAENIYAVELAAKYGLPIIAGTSMNITNSIAAEVLGNCRKCASVELKRSEIFSDKLFIYTYGHLPLMTLAHCPIKLISGKECTECGYKAFAYTDDKGVFYVRRERLSDCVFTLYNGSVHDIADVVNGGKLLDLTVSELDPNTVIANAYYGMRMGAMNATGGGYKRGVK